MQYQMQQMQLRSEEEQGSMEEEESIGQGGFGQPPPPPSLGPTTGGPLIGRDEQKGWMDRTLRAAGLDDDDDDDDDNIPLHQVRSSLSFLSFLPADDTHAHTAPVEFQSEV